MGLGYNLIFHEENIYNCELAYFRRHNRKFCIWKQGFGGGGDTCLIRLKPNSSQVLNESITKCLIFSCLDISTEPKEKEINAATVMAQLVGSLLYVSVSFSDTVIKYPDKRWRDSSCSQFKRTVHHGVELKVARGWSSWSHYIHRQETKRNEYKAGFSSLIL